MTVVTADEDSGVEMSHPRADNGKFQKSTVRYKCKVLSKLSGKIFKKDLTISCFVEYQHFKAKSQLCGVVILMGEFKLYI